MDCNCNGNTNAGKEAAASGGSLKQGFRAFWPDQYAYPPGAPWLAAAVTRVEAFDLVQRFSGSFPGLESGDFGAYADLVSAVLYSDKAVYAQERKKKKEKPPTTPTNCQYSGTCNGVSQSVVCSECLGTYCEGSVLKCLQQGMGGGGIEPLETETSSGGF